MHIPVMKRETIEALHVQPNHWYLDGTFGRGGHTREILDKGGKVVAFDLDHDAILHGQTTFANELAAGNLILVHGNFAHLTRHLKEINKDAHSFAGALFDLGMSSGQIDESGRGFTFQDDQPLDMRMNTDMGVTAADLVNALPEKHLKSLFWDCSQETFASAIAREIVRRREHEPIRTTRQLADLIARVKRPHQQHSHLHPATKVFMALRMAVNTELDNLAVLLDQVLVWLEPQAYLVFLSFHEGEDRLVKHTLRDWEKANRGEVLTQKVETPSEQEIADNPRARSAKMRVFRVGQDKNNE